MFRPVALIVAVSFAAEARAQSVDGALTCTSSYTDTCFNCSNDEDNDCASYPGSSCNPTPAVDTTLPASQRGKDKIFSFTPGTQDAWVELTFQWGWDEDMDFYVGRGSMCSNPSGLPCYTGTTYGYETPVTAYWEADHTQPYYVAFDENAYDVFWGDWSLSIPQIRCCFDGDGDGTYSNPGAPGNPRCPLLQDAGYGGPHLVDCDDNDPAKAPGNVEICDGKDNDCNGSIDEGIGTNLYYRDSDADGYGDPSSVKLSCSLPPGYVTNPLDCDDLSFVRRPGLAETCDGKDNDCDLVVDEGTRCFDDDDDGWTEAGGDCDDASRGTRPGATELCNGRDDDCDGVIDEGTPCYDDDGDCFCEVAPCAGSSFGGCASVPGGDCSDYDPDVNPGAHEVPGNGIDDDCDDVLDGGGLDGDRDGWLAEAGDCNTSDAAVFPGAPELADGKDNDCDGTIDEGTARYDDDGDCACEAAPCVGSASAACVAVVGGDCDDTSTSVGPAAPDTAGNGIDDDCDGIVDDGGPQVDDDGDGLSEAQGDCDDDNPRVGPGERELDNDVDDDCDGAVDEDFEDFDRDGVTAAAGDCDDDDGWVRPGLAEMCDGVDNDCDSDVDEGCDDDEIVIVDTGTSGGCGCATGGATGSWWVGLVVLAWTRRATRRAA